MIYFVLAIIILTVVETYFISDIGNIFKINGIITITAGYMTIILNYILKRVIVKKISFINISKVTNAILMKAVNRGLILILIGGIELVIYIIIYIYKKRRIISK